MGTTNPPSGWSVGSGTWGTDMDQNTSVTVVGGYSIEFKATAPGAAPYLISDYIPSEPNTPYLVRGLLRSARVNAGDIMEIGVGWYTSAKAFISWGTAFQDELDVINTWYEISDIEESPSTAAYRRVYVQKFDVGFQCFFDYAEAVKMPRTFLGYSTAAQTCPQNVYVRMMLDTSEYNYGSMLVEGDTGSITAFADAGGGQVTVTSNAHGLSNGDWIQIYDTTNYNTYGATVSNVAANTFEITAAWAGDDAQGEWVSGGYFEAPRTGTYDIDAQTWIEDIDDNESCSIFLMKDTTLLLIGNVNRSTGANKDVSASVSASLYLNRGEKVSAMMAHDHAGDLSSATTVRKCHMAVTEGNR